jgi:hypothetical protein
MIEGLTVRLAENLLFNGLQELAEGYTFLFHYIIYKLGAKILLFSDKRTKETKKFCSYVLMSNKLYTFARKMTKPLLKL